MVFLLKELDLFILEFAIRKLNPLLLELKAELVVLILKTSELFFSFVLLTLLRSRSSVYIRNNCLIFLAESETLLLAKVFPWVPKMNNLNGIWWDIDSK